MRYKVPARSPADVHNRKKWQSTCPYCGETFRRVTYYHPKQWTRQHLLPVRRGGKLTIDNWRPCCKECNSWLNTCDDCPVILFSAWAMLPRNQRHLTPYLLLKMMGIRSEEKLKEKAERRRLRREQFIKDMAEYAKSLPKWQI